jgi:hypothetical protein
VPTGCGCHLAVDLARKIDLIAMPSMDIAPRPRAAPESPICRIQRRETTLFDTRPTAWKTIGVALQFPCAQRTGIYRTVAFATLSQRCDGIEAHNPAYLGWTAAGDPVLTRQ